MLIILCLFYNVFDIKTYVWYNNTSVGILFYICFTAYETLLHYQTTHDNKYQNENHLLNKTQVFV